MIYIFEIKMIEALAAFQKLTPIYICNHPAHVASGAIINHYVVLFRLNKYAINRLIVCSQLVQ